MRIRLAQLRWTFAACALVITSCGSKGLQREDQFAWAMETGAGSTSPPVVRIRLFDTQGGSGSIRCVFSDELIHAVMLENRIPLTKEGYDRAISIALASRDHSFRFDQPAARNVITATHGMTDAGLSKACRMIEQGKSALWADMQARVVEGPHFPRGTERR